jgi:hypothetical protein
MKKTINDSNLTFLGCCLAPPNLKQIVFSAAFLAMLASTHAVNSQCLSPQSIVQNGGFESFLSNCGSPSGNTIDAAFNLGCVTSWHAAFGTPSLCLLLANPASGEAFACMGSNTEAIFQTLNLCPGETYQLTFKYRGISSLNTPSILDVYMANGLEPVTTTNNPSGQMAIDPSWQSLGSVQVTNSTWQTATWTFTITNPLNSQLLFLVDEENRVAYGIDDVSLTCVTPIQLDFTSFDLGNGVFHFEADMPSGVTGCWDFGDGTVAFGGNNINHTFSQPGQYQVCLIAMCGCYESVCNTITVQSPPVLSCPCSETNTINIIASEQGTPYSLLESAQNYDQNDDGVIDETEHNGCIAIYGRLIVDQDVTIEGCDNIRMQPCAEIVVNGFRHLTMEYNTIYGCETMWKSITVESLSHLTFLHNKVSDAQHSLWANPTLPFTLLTPTRVDIQHNRFERNHINLFIPGNGGGYFGGTVWQTPFIGNNILCKGPGNSLGDLLPPCDAGLDNYDNEHGYAGAVVLGANFNIGEPGGAYNTFSNLRNGVIGERVFLNVDRSNFNNMIGFSDFQPNFALSRGVGVVANGGQYNVRDASFIGAGHAVYSNFSILSMQRNSTDNVRFGLEAWNPVRSEIMENKDFGFLDFGIRAWNLFGVQGFSFHTIDDNVFKAQNVQTATDGDWAVQLHNLNNFTLPDNAATPLS